MAVEPPYDNYCAKIAEEIAQMLLKIRRIEELKWECQCTAAMA